MQARNWNRRLVAAAGLGAALCALGLAGAGLAAGLGHPAAGKYRIEQFTDARSCGMCHPTQLAQWSGTLHAQSSADPFYQRVVHQAEADLPGVSEFCASCHSPIAIYTGQDELNPASLTGAAAGGLQCDFCHTVSAFRHLGNFGFENTPGMLKYGPFGAQPPIFHTVQESALHDSAEFCGMCHDVSHPLNGLALETTFSEFKAGPYPAEGVKCQTCHMTPGLTHFEAFPGASANGAEEREHIWTHWFVGGNAWIPEMMGNPGPAEIARARLAQAAAVEVLPYDIVGGELRLEVRVTNVGAGHKIPTGVTEERQIWLEVELYASDGTLLQAWGKPGEDGVIPDDTMILGTVFGDADARPTHKIWQAASVLSDQRIAPRESLTWGYSYELGPRAVGRIEARLYYRSSAQDFVDSVFADTPERELVPHVLMAQAEYTPDATATRP
jgi:hypothetical protein